MKIDESAKSLANKLANLVSRNAGRLLGCEAETTDESVIKNIEDSWTPIIAAEITGLLLPEHADNSRLLDLLVECRPVLWECDRTDLCEKIDTELKKRNSLTKKVSSNEITNNVPTA